MKKFVLFAVILFPTITYCQINKEDKVGSDRNKSIATLYHQRTVKDIDSLFTVDFVGESYRGESKPIVWNKESHRRALINYPNIIDSVLVQIAEKDWVAEHIIRTTTYGGNTYKTRIMQFSQFDKGKIKKCIEVINYQSTTKAQ